MPTRRNLKDIVPISNPDRDPASVWAVILARSSGGSDEEDVQAQVKECKAFLVAHKWTQVRPDFEFAEIHRSARRDVVREKLDAVLRLAETGTIDVIICREFERLARDSRRGYATVAIAARFGVEFRFANRPPDGVLPDDPMSEVYQVVLDQFGKLEAERFRERTMRPLRERYEAGIPGGSRTKYTYGYQWPKLEEGQKPTSKHNGVYDTSRFIEHPEHAAVLLRLYRAVDEREATLRGLAMELEADGTPTPTGAGHWSPKVIGDMLRNPMYCGRGRTGRYSTTWVRRQDTDTHRANDYRVVTDRMRDPVAWENETVAIPVERAPILIPPDLFDRVQRILGNLQNNRGTRTTARPVVESQLQNGIVRCARCEGAMVRAWDRSGRLMYRCNRRGGNPAHPCRSHDVPALATDDLVRHMVARVLTDPDDLLKLADAATMSLADQRGEEAVATATLDAYREQLAKAEADRVRYTKIRALLDPITEATEIAHYQALIAKADEDRAKLQEAITAATPRRTHARTHGSAWRCSKPSVPIVRRR